MRDAARLTLPLLFTLCVALQAVAVQAETAEALPANGLGVSLTPRWEEPEGPVLPGPWKSPSPEAPLYARILVEDALLDLPERVAGLLEGLALADLVPILVLEPPGGTGDKDTLDFDLNRWLSRLDAFLMQVQREPLLLQVGDRPAERFTPRLHAFVLKRVSVLVRSQAPRMHIATGGIDDPDHLADLAGMGIDPYIDAVCLRSGLDLDAILDVAQAAFPGRRLWLQDAGLARPLLQEAGRAFSRAVSLVIAAPGAAPPPERLAAWRRLLVPSAAVVPYRFGRVSAHDADGNPRRSDEIMEITSDSGRHVLLFTPADVGALTLSVEGPPVGIAWRVDPVTGEERIAGTAQWLSAEGGAAGGASRLQVEPDTSPFLLRLSGLGNVPVLTAEEHVTGQRGLTVDEIVARHLQFQARQDRMLDTIAADARIDYHFSLANLNQTFDVTTLNRYLYDGQAAVYEERELYLNGSLWRGKKPPDLPFVLPEKVTEVPLDLRLDRRYEFRLEGRNPVAGRDAYRVSFSPLRESGAAYTGKVWIDAEEFNLLRMEAVEVDEELPVISNKLVQTFSRVESGGRSWWLPVRVDGQMVFTALGRNVVLERTLQYTDLVVNPADLQDQIQAAYASSHQVLQETDSGFKRLDKVAGDDGTWQVREDRASKTGVSRLLVGGMSLGDELDIGLPFAGVNYFNFDFRGTGTQLDVAWAGPFLNVFWSDPALSASKLIFSVEGRINPIERTDRRLDFTDMLRDDAQGERLQVTDQLLSATLGYPIGTFHKVEMTAAVDFLAFDGDDATDPTFAVPMDTEETSVALRWAYNRAGVRLEWGAQGGRRSDWRFWGRPDGSDFRPAHQRWVRSFLFVNKNFYPRKFDRFGFGLSLFDGNGLDRFSRFDVGGFGGGRVSGFSGDGLTFDRGGILDVNYSLNLGARARLDLTLNHGRFRNEVDLGPGTQHATGAGIAVNFSGPFNTFVRVRLGGGIDSSVADVHRSTSLRLTFFRTFDRWFWQRRGSRGPGPSAMAEGEKRKPRLPREEPEETGAF